MKKRLQGLIAGVLIGAMLTGGMTFAKQANEMAELFYNNIKIFIDGGEITPKDANGNVAEPFIVNGTTYLPVRAVSNAFGKEVEWDGATQSVYIGKKDQTKPDQYLDKIQYNDYKEGNGGDNFAIIQGSVADFSGNIYKSGILCYIYSTWDSISEDADAANQLVAYPLNSQYKRFVGKIVLPKSVSISTWEQRDNMESKTADVFIYGDNKLLYKATNVTSSMPFAFDINTTGVNQLQIKIKAHNDHTYVALTDLALYK